MTPETLAAGVAGKWFDCRAFIAADLSLIVVIAGGAVATLEASNDKADPKSADVIPIESYSLTVGKVLIAPLPDFVRIRNSGGAGTVTYAFGSGPSKQTIDTPRSGAFSS